MKRSFSICFVLIALVFVVSCGGSKKDEAQKNDNDTVDADDADEISDSTTEDDADTEDPGKKQGELYGECYPNKTCNEGLVCDTENNVCIKDPGNPAEPEDDEPDKSDDDADTEDPSRKQGELYGRCYPNKTCNEGLECDIENDICIKKQNDDTDSAPDHDTDTSDTGITDNDITEIDDTDTTAPDNDNDIDTEVTENHKISGFYQIGSNVAGIEAALYECGGATKIAFTNTDVSGKYSFNADISADKAYCVKANGFASCFKGLSDHTANISEITNAVLLLDSNCENLRKSETKVRTYAKLGTGEWLGELDYTKLSGISEGLNLLVSYLKTQDPSVISAKIAEDIQKTDREFQKFFNGFKISASKHEVVIDTANPANNEIPLSIEGGSSVVAPGFKILWRALNSSIEAATHKISSMNPGEYLVRAKLSQGEDTVSEDSSTFLYLLENLSGTIDVSDMSKDISHYIDNGIYVVIPKNTQIKKNGSKVNTLTYKVLSAGDASQVSKIDFGPEGTTFSGDSMYFVYELGTIFGGDPIMLSATRSNADGSNDVLESTGGDPIMLEAGGDPIMFSAGGDTIMQMARSAGGDPIMISAGGDPIMMDDGSDPIMLADGGDPIMISAGGDPIMSTAAGDPIMLGTSTSVMVAKTEHFSGFLLNSNSLKTTVDALIEKWCRGSFYHDYSPIEFIRQGIQKYKPEGEAKERLLSYFTCNKLADLESDLYELINKPLGYQRNLNLIENIFYISEFYNRLQIKRTLGGEASFAAVRNGLELRSAIAALYTATTAYNRSSTTADLFDSAMIPMTYLGTSPADYSANAQKAVTGLSELNDNYVAGKKDLMIFANYITTSSKGPDFSAVTQVLTPDKLICAWFNPETAPASCNKIYTLNNAGHVTENGAEVSVEKANAIFSKFFMPMNSRLSNAEKLNLFRTFYLVLRYAGTIFYNGENIENLNENLLETAYMVFDGIDGNINAVSIVDTFDAAAHTVQVLDGTDMTTLPYISKISALTDKIALKVAAESAYVEKVLVRIEGYEFEKVTENTRTYYKPEGDLKEQSVVLLPGTLNNGLKPLSDLLWNNNVDSLGNITGRMTIVVNSRIDGKTYTTQKTYEFLANTDSDGVESKPLPANLQIFLHNSDGYAIPETANPGIILNPGNRAFYPNEDGVINITELVPASYTIDAFADGYYAKNVGVNVSAGATIPVEIRLDSVITSSADANLELQVKINTAKHPDKVYIQIYDEDMQLVANESARFDEDTNTYETVNIEMNSGRYTLLAVGEEMYNYLETITLYEGDNSKEITVVAKNACGNGIVDSAEECEPSVEGSLLTVLCGEIYPAATNPGNNATCNPDTCTFDKSECGKAALCGDGIIDLGEGCDGGAKECSEITGFGSSKGSAPCASNCSDWITAGNCSRTTESCGNLPDNALWNDGLGRFTQVYNGENWNPATKNMVYGFSKSECVFSCRKGFRWNGSECVESPLSLGLLCTGETSCFDNTDEGVCPAYGKPFFGQDSQYAEVGYCTPHSFEVKGNGEEKIVADQLTHFEWQKTASDSAMNWAAADEYCMQSDYAGITEWKLPTPAELLTIIDSGHASPALDPDYFTTSGHTFWATEDKKTSGNAWRISADGALTSVAKTAENYVICVHVNEQVPISERFTATDETVKDNLSTLMWQKNYASSKTWQEALEYCESLTVAGHYDWRLPNRNELASLADHEKTSGTTSAFPGIAGEKFWTSTTSMNSASAAWTVDFNTGALSAGTKSETNYVLCVRNDEPCFGEGCVNACNFEPCKNIENSTGVCTASDSTFYCGCKSGFNWDMARAVCSVDETRYTPCEGLPEHAKWNTAHGISQMWNGDEWYPSEIGKYNETASTKECRFICETNYDWDSDSGKCVAQSRYTACTNKPQNSIWNSVSGITQTWNGSSWEPAEVSVFNEVESEAECRFKCREHFSWDSEEKICNAETVSDVACTGLPEEGASWNGTSTITQTWNGVDWVPSATGIYDLNPGVNECHFKCDTNYDWDGETCAAKSRIANCSVPENAVSNTATMIMQTWNGSSNSWQPSITAVYDENPSMTECHFICDSTHFWDGENCTSPCDYEPCEIAHSTGICTASSWNEYECGCDDDYYWETPLCKKISTIGNICTGQTKCYNASEEIPCPSQGAEFYGQDAQYAQLGKCTPKNFVIDSTVPSEKTVFDKNTRLEWQQTIPDKYTWTSAESYCDTLNYGGHNDWRLPTPQELLTLAEADGRINALSFPNTPSSGDDYFWSILSADSKTAWTISFVNTGGKIEQCSISSSFFSVTQTNYVRCVRGITLKSGKFTTSTINGDAIVTDSTSELIWQGTTSTTYKNWTQALDYCENLTYAGYSDWRLPNKNELLSLINYTKSSAPYSDFPDIDAIWSSTTYGTNIASIFYIQYNMDPSSLVVEQTLVNYRSKTGGLLTGSLAVRCVRSE